MAADPTSKVSTGPSPELAMENLFWFAMTPAENKQDEKAFTHCDFCKAKPGREKAQEHLKAQAHLFETKKAVEYITQYTRLSFSKIPFPLEKEALHKTEAICAASLRLIIVQKILINLRDFHIVLW